MSPTLVIGTIILIIILLVASLLLWTSSRPSSDTYGPEALPDGRPRARGTLICESWKAPTLGDKLTFAYEVAGFAEGNNLGGAYQYKPAKRNKVTYSGEVLLTHSQGAVKGRTRMRENKVIMGDVSGGQADLTLGYGENSLLRFLNAPFRFGMQGDRVRFLNTDNGQGSINQRSELTVTENRIRGRLVHSRESWVVEVDVAYEEIDPTLLTLIILLAGNDILSFHHD